MWLGPRFTPHQLSVTVLQNRKGGTIFKQQRSVSAKEEINARIHFCNSSLTCLVWANDTTCPEIYLDKHQSNHFIATVPKKTQIFLSLQGGKVAKSQLLCPLSPILSVLSRSHRLHLWCTVLGCKLAHKHKHCSRIA